MTTAESVAKVCGSTRKQSSRSIVGDAYRKAVTVVSEQVVRIKAPVVSDGTL